MQLPSSAPAATFAPTATSAPAGSMRSGVVGLFVAGNTTDLLRRSAPLGPVDGYATLDAAITGLASLTAGEGSAVIDARGGRFIGHVLGRSTIQHVPHGVLDRAPEAFDLRGLMHHGQGIAIDLLDPTAVAIVDGGFNERHRHNSGVVLRAPQLRIDAQHAEQLTPGHAAENSGKLIDLGELAGHA